MDISKIIRAIEAGTIVEFRLSAVEGNPKSAVMVLKSKSGRELSEKLAIPESERTKPGASEIAFNELIKKLGD